jgi:hypothetical protein
LARLRDVSRLVLVAIEQDDLQRVSQLAREADTLVASVLAYQETEHSLSDEARALVEQIAAANQRVIANLMDEMRATEQEVTRVRSSRTRLRASGLPHRPATTLHLDRET